MPQNCSADVQAVITHIDQVFTNGSQSEINSIKNLFGLGGLSHLDDTAGACKEFFKLSAPTDGNVYALFAWL